MRYAYNTPSELSSNFLLGSAVRGLGKGWKIDVECSEENEIIFKRFRELLQKKTQFQICGNDIESTHRFQLLLREFPQSSFDIISNHVIDTVVSANVSIYDLVSDVKFSTLNSKGVTAITGNGKGKTTLALGLAAQNILSRQKSLIIQWFKEKKSGDLTWAINEHFFSDMLKDPDLIIFNPTGLGFFGSPNMDRVKGEEAYKRHREKAYEGLQLARTSISSGEYSLIVLDELVDTVKEIAQNIEYPLIDLKDLQAFLQWVIQQPVEIVITGRRVTEDWKEFINTSIVISEVKHPWSTSKSGAISGLDF